MDRGVSEIISSVLMILLVSAIGIGIFLYGMGFFSGITSARQQSTYMDIQSVKENFVIVDASIANKPGVQSKMAVYNYGTVTVNLVALYINGIKFDLIQEAVIEPYQYGWIHFYADNIPGDYCYVKVVSSRGNTCEGIFEAEGGT